MPEKELVTYLESRGKYFVMKKDGSTFNFDSKDEFENFLETNNFKISS